MKKYRLNCSELNEVFRDQNWVDVRVQVHSGAPKKIYDRPQSRERHIYPKKKERSNRMQQWST